MTDSELYRDHLARLDQIVTEALTRWPGDAVLFHAGEERTYPGDDQPIPFRPSGHFARWVPLPGPGHFVLARPGRRPLVARFAPRDFWFEHAVPEPSYWQEAVDLVEFESADRAATLLDGTGRVAYVGGFPDAARRLGFEEERINPPELVAVLDWHRAVKTAHEVALAEEAARRAAAGHEAARRAFLEGKPERAIYWAFLEGSGMLERELPFEPIVALDDRAAILHYQNKRPRATGRVLLLDAGAGCDGFASDITRTTTSPDAAPEFVALVGALDRLQRRLVAMVSPGRPYPEIHAAAVEGVAAILVEAGVLRRPDPSVARRFFPHGVGHHLGFQVHDVGGHQAGPAGGTVAPPDEDPFLRNTRRLEEGHLVTIEPGIYFIRDLLEPLRSGPEADLVDWTLVDRLAGHGGIRIEDDVLCTAEGPRDLTRPLLD
ncbi:MAG: Xaa-Pro dipeptidase [Acidobacteria bacterium]|nr:MAG: Xaa-Pro dipeptidase [Acidobacteriota bacterium]